MDGVPTLQRYLIKKTVTTCCEGYSRINYRVDEYGWEEPVRDEYGELVRYCTECGKLPCDIKELVWMTHKQVAKGCYRPLPEPVLVSEFIFDNL